MQITAQITVGSDLQPNSGSLLDLKQNDGTEANSTKGLLFSRVELIDINKLDPCVSSASLEPDDKKIHIGLLVYNITDRPEDGLCPGIHVWEGENWTRLPEPCQKPIVPIDPDLLFSPNCYIVAPSGVSEEIPIAKAYLVSEQRSDLTDLNRGQKVYLEVLWQDTQDLIDKVELMNGDEGIYSKFKVTTKNNGKKGNALIALHVGPNGDKSDDIAWSWHIWVTDYNPDTNTNGTTYSHNNGDLDGDYIFMDRNLGAITASPATTDVMGLTYQWGRKDPFTSNVSFASDYNFRPLYDKDNALIKEEIGGVAGNTGIGITHELAPTDKTNNLEYSVRNPMVFYYGPFAPQNSPFDWFTSTDDLAAGDNNLWGDSGKKSSFDPCPKGWRVPAYSKTTGKSPFTQFLAEYSLGMAESKPSHVTTDPSGNALVFGESLPSITSIGVFPYGMVRWPRESPTASAVGGAPGTISGGFSGYLAKIMSALKALIGLLHQMHLTPAPKWDLSIEKS